MRATVLLLSICFPGAWATRKEISRELDPYDAERFLYSVSQAIQAPGTVDLSRLVFSNMKQYSYSTDDTYNNENNENEPYNEMAIEAALLYCGNDDNCNLQQLGIGTYSDGIHYRCCTTDAMTAGVCENEGRLVVDDDVFSGQWFDVVAAGNDNNNPTYTVDDPILTVQQSGVYMVVLANCNQYGIPVLTKGQLGFRSRYGYLLANDWKCSWISHTFTLISAAALVWLYRHNTRRSMDTVVLITVSLAFVQSFVLGLYYLEYNRTGITPDTLHRVQLCMNALMLSLANVCMVLAAFGWGCLEKVYTSVPIHMICGLGTISFVILFIIASWKDQHMFITGEILSISFATWALQVNLKTLHMLRSKNSEELFRRWAFMRALLVLSICQSGALGCIYLGVSRNNGSNTQPVFMIIQQFVLLAILAALAYLVRPYYETLLSGKDGMDTESQNSDLNKRGIDP